jgi:hypothetical protein
MDESVIGREAVTFLFSGLFVIPLCVNYPLPPFFPGGLDRHSVDPKELRHPPAIGMKRFWRVGNM